MKRIFTLIATLALSVILVAGCQNATTIPAINSSQTDMVAEAVADILMTMQNMPDSSSVMAAGDKNFIEENVKGVRWTNVKLVPEVTEKFRIDFNNAYYAVDNQGDTIAIINADISLANISMNLAYEGQFVSTENYWLKTVIREYDSYRWYLMTNENGAYALAMDVYGTQFDPDSVAFLNEHPEVSAYVDGGPFGLMESEFVLDPVNLADGKPYYIDGKIGREEWDIVKGKVFQGNVSASVQFQDEAQATTIALEVSASGNGDITQRYQTILISDALGNTISYDLDMLTGSLTHVGSPDPEAAVKCYPNQSYPNDPPLPGEPGAPPYDNQLPPTNEIPTNG